MRILKKYSRSYSLKMIDKLRSVTKTRFRKTNFNAFLFFLFLAVIIWFFSQFSKVYDEIVEIPVKYTNTPPDKFLQQNNPDHLKLRMQNTGFKISYLALFPPTLTIDLSKTTEQDGDLVYLIDEHRDDIQSQLGISFDNSNFLWDELRIHYQQQREKKLPVISEIDIDYAVGYAATNKIQLQPDSITVSGPNMMLDTLTELHTLGLQLSDVKEDLRGEVAIDTSDLPKITLYTQEVSYALDVEKFTEGRVKIPVQLTNVPPGLDVVIFPKEILVFYQVNLKDYNSIVSSDFRIVCDFGQIQGNQDFLIPKITKQPPNVANLRLNEKKIQFIIKK